MLYLNPADLPPQLRHLHSKGLIRAQLATQASIPPDAGLWSGGTIRHFAAVCLATGETRPLSDSVSAPWDPSRTRRTYTLQPGYAVAEYGSFCGKPAGLTLYVHPADAWPALAAPQLTLTPVQLKVLQACVQIKAGAYRWDWLARNSVTRSQYESAIPQLQALGLLAANKAPTPQGRNFVNSLPQP